MKNIWRSLLRVQNNRYELPETNCGQLVVRARKQYAPNDAYQLHFLLCSHHTCQFSFGDIRFVLCKCCSENVPALFICDDVIQVFALFI